MIQSIIKTLNSYTNAVGPFREAVGLAIKGSQFIRAGIAILLNAGSPITIGWLVPEVVIATLYRVFFRRARTHISVKRLKGVSPFFAYGYSPATVILESSKPGIAATLLHGAPGFIFRRTGHSVGRAPTNTPSRCVPITRVSLVCSAGVLLLLATTGLRMAVTQIAQRNHSDHAAAANALPEHASNDFLTVTCGGPVSELCPSGYIDPSCHNVLLREKLWRSGSLAAETACGPHCIIPPKGSTAL